MDDDEDDISLCCCCYFPTADMYILRYQHGTCR